LEFIQTKVVNVAVCFFADSTDEAEKLDANTKGSAYHYPWNYLGDLIFKCSVS
jgi:hypothetical protein